MISDLGCVYGIQGIAAFGVGGANFGDRLNSPVRGYGLCNSDDCVLANRREIHKTFPIFWIPGSW